MRRTLNIAKPSAAFAVALRTYAGMTRCAPLARAASRAMAAATTTSAMRFVSHAQLNKVALQELDEEESRDDKEPQPEIPQGWDLKHTPGKAVFTMTKNYQDEKLEIECNLKDMEPAGEGAQPPAHVSLIVTKGGKALAFSLAVENNELVFDGVAHFPVAADAKNEQKLVETYQGPQIGELSEAIVEAFLSYLEERGVDDALAEFIARYAYWVEQQEYEDWLKKVADFTK